MKPSGPGLLFVGRFLITVLITVLVLGLLRFSISSWFSLEGYIFLRICPFLPRCPFYWHIFADSSLLWFFVFLCCLCGFPIFISSFVDLILLSFFPDESGLLFVYFIYLPKNQLLALYIFNMVSFVSFLFQFSRLVVCDSFWPHEPQHSRLPCPSPLPESTQTHVHQGDGAIQPFHPLPSPSPPALNLSQHQSFFQ